jgi:RNA-directed DNA polymerase
MAREEMEGIPDSSPAHHNVAILMSFSRKGPWKCAWRLATQTGMTIKWLKDEGLLSVKELWVKIHSPTTVR